MFINSYTINLKIMKNDSIEVDGLEGNIKLGEDAGEAPDAKI